MKINGSGKYHVWGIKSIKKQIILRIWKSDVFEILYAPQRSYLSFHNLEARIYSTTYKGYRELPRISATRQGHLMCRTPAVTVVATCSILLSTTFKTFKIVIEALSKVKE